MARRPSAKTSETKTKMSTAAHRTKKPAKSAAASKSSKAGAEVKAEEAAKPLILYQGEPGANSHLACVNAYPNMKPGPSSTFEDAFADLEQGKADFAMIAIENTLAGRVADVHHLLPISNLYIVGEHFEPIHHQLMVLPGTKLENVKTVHSHVHALGQCRKVIRELGLKPVVASDTAGAARILCEEGDKTKAVIASTLAANLYELEIVRKNIEDAAHNTTRFIVLSKEANHVPFGDGLVVTTFTFRVKNIPAALFWALSGFAANGVNMTKLESYLIEGNFTATMFYADIEGHPEDEAVERALEVCKLYSSEFHVLGTYPASPFREEFRAKNGHSI
ncbi:MAG: prephenate dehydratase [Alphaproteobacteria bacterium]